MNKGIKSYIEDKESTSVFGSPTPLLFTWFAVLSVAYYSEERRVGKGISAQASHITVREPLGSYGSCYLNPLFIPFSQ